MIRDDRLQQLRTGRDILDELEEALGGQGKQSIQSSRVDLVTAGTHLGNANFDRHFEKAMVRAAGMAAAMGEDDLSDRARSVLDGGA